MPLLAVAGRLVEKVCLTLALLGFDFLEPPGKSGNPEKIREKAAKKAPEKGRQFSALSVDRRLWVNG